MRTSEERIIRTALDNARGVVSTLELLVRPEVDIETAVLALAGRYHGQLVGASQGEFVVKFAQAKEALKFVTNFHSLTSQMLWYPEETVNDEWIVKIPV